MPTNISLQVIDDFPIDVLDQLNKLPPEVISHLLISGIHNYHHLSQLSSDSANKLVIKQIEAKHAEDIASLRNEHSSMIKKLHNDLSHQSISYQQQLESVLSSKDLELKSLQEQSQLKLKAIDLKYSSTIDDLNTTILHLRSSIEANKDFHTSSLQDQFNIKIQSLESKYTSTIDDLHTTIAHLRSTIESKNKGLSELQQEIERKNTEKTTEIHSYIQQGFNLSKKEFDSFIALQLDDKRHLQDKIALQEATINDLLRQINETSIQHIHQLTDSHKSAVSELKDQFGFIKDRLTGNASKGEVGENITEQYITQHFSTFSLIDTSKSSAKGDFLLHNHTFKLLIENKNVQHIKSCDIDKFYRDVSVNAGNGSINAALFISLQDTFLTQGKKNFLFELKHGVPIIFIGNVLNNIDLIKFSINILLYLVENGITKHTDDPHNDLSIDLTSLINSLLSHYDKNLKLIANNKKLIESLLDNIKAQSLSLDDLYTHFHPFVSKYPQFHSTSSNEQPSALLDAVVQAIIILLFFSI
jgi:hypothetical protein